MTIRRLDDAERAEAAAALRKVFVGVDPFDQPFAPEVDVRTILAPINNDMDEGELRAVAAASEASGDRVFYVSIVDDENWRHSPDHWAVPVDHLEAYEELEDELMLRQTNAVYSPSGAWAMLRSVEMHALAGGRGEPIRRFLDEYPAVPPIGAQGTAPLEPARQVESFLSWWAEQSAFSGTPPWLPTLLAHVYGERCADVLLQQFAGMLRRQREYQGVPDAGIDGKRPGG